MLFRSVEIHGIPPIGSGLSLGHLLHFQQDRPEIHDATALYLEPMDYVVARLTGTAVGTQNTMFTSQLCDNRSLGATTYDERLLSMAGVDARRLPPLVAVDAVVGEVRPELGLGSGVAERTTAPRTPRSTGPAARSPAPGARRARLPGSGL